MIADDDELHRTQELVIRFENELLSLRNRIYETDPVGFRLMGGAIVDEIEILRAGIDEYIGLKTIREREGALTRQ